VTEDAFLKGVPGQAVESLCRACVAHGRAEAGLG
jgi:hypothetical protein